MLILAALLISTPFRREIRSAHKKLDIAPILSHHCKTQNILTTDKFFLHRPLMDRIKSLLDVDWTKRPYIFILALSFVLSRVPLLNLGFGADGDAWRVANTAFDLRTSHTYHYSRPPGYPLPEYLDSLVIDHGWMATNILTLIIFFISAVFFAKILKDLDVKNKGLLVLAYAFMPIMWINSANTMDYLWALAFIVIAWFFALRSRWVLGGLMLGLAIASRMTSAIFLLPFLYLILTEDRERREKSRSTICLGLAAAAVALILYLPVFLQHGRGFLTYYPMDLSLVDAAGFAVNSFGIIPTFVGFILLTLSLKVLFKHIRQKDRHTIFLLSAVMLVVIMFIKLPMEVEYLLPAVPFGLLLVNSIARRDLVLIFCILLILHSFVTFTVQRNDEGILGTRGPDGMIKRNNDERNSQLDYAESLMGIRLAHSIVIVGSKFPAAVYWGRDKGILDEHIGTWAHKYEGIWNREDDVCYRYLVPLDELQSLQDEGYAVYYIEEMREYTQDIEGYDLDTYGGEYLPVSDG